MRIEWLIFLFLVTSSGYSQMGKWESDLVVNYKMTDKNGKLQNSIEIKKDTLYYQWLEKDKVTNRLLVGDTALETKLITIMNKHGFLKFKSAKINTQGSNIVFNYKKTDKQKVLVMPQNIKAGSKEEWFIKEFLEAIVIKVFAQDIKNFPK